MAFRRFLILIIISLSFTGIRAQEGYLSGLVVDSLTGEAIPGAHVIIDSSTVVTTGSEGRFYLNIEEGTHELVVSYVGYSHYRKQIRVTGHTLLQEIRLKPGIQLEAAVVTASLYEQRLADVSVSMQVMKADYIDRVITRQLDETLELLPGVDVIDGQANIRNGSGYSYGAGSRVMLLVDGMPMLTGDVNDIKWSFVPVENVGQVEVIKGASSSLYGSSALNGVINIRTAPPGPEPETRAEAFGGLYMHPQRREMSSWWDHNPLYGGVRAVHLRKIGRTDLTIGVSAYGDESYREDNSMLYGRVNLDLKHRLKGSRETSIGLRTAIHFQQFSDFLIWQDADSGAWRQQAEAVTPTNGFRFHIDPWFSTYDKREGKHLVQARFYQVTNRFPDDPDKENASGNYFGEYRYSRSFSFGLHLAAGVSGTYTSGNSNLYGDHYGSSFALYAQLDQQFFKKLMLNLGLRWERFGLDGKESDSRPVIRAGLNYAIATHTRLRASFGQGYRYPSMTEKYTSTTLSGVNIFPNEDLQPETGWSTEAGAQQGFMIGSWSGYVDAVAFRTEYNNMIEFTFGAFKPDTAEVPTLDDIGFKPLNVGKARIDGIELTVNTRGNIGPVVMTAMAGYTYTDPVDLSNDSIGEQILKYRYRNGVKADLQADYGDFTLGLSLVYRSFMERIDAAFEEVILGQEIFPGLKAYRAENNQGHVVIDLRAGWQITRASGVTLVIRNLFNEEYMGRPGDIGPPMNISVKYSLSL